MSLHTMPKTDDTIVTLFTDEGGQSAAMSLNEFKGLSSTITQALAYQVPPEETFDEADYLPAHDLDMMLSRLVDRHETLFGHLVRLKIVCLWKANGGASKGKPVTGKVVPATGLIGYFSEMDFIIWLAADHLRNGNASEKVVEACLFERACALQWDAEGGKVQVASYDFAGYTESLKFYGAWRTDLKKASSAFEQLTLR